MKTNILLLLVILTAASVWGADGAPRAVTATRVAEAPVIDGVLEDVWFKGAPARDFGQFRPLYGSTPDGLTEVYVLYDDAALYVGWVCHESKPAGLVATATVRDMFLNDDDSIDFLLDSTNSGTDCYDLMVNCRGTRYDGTITRDGDDSGLEWDAYWEAKTSIGADAWYCEMAIPWTSFRYDRKASSFGVNFLRFRKPVFEESFWICEGGNPNRISNFGRVEGFENLPAPKPIKFTPYATARAEDSMATPAYPLLEETDGWEFKPRAGFDFEYRPGSNVNAMATFLPDYAYIEADPAQINLAPEEIYLYEKRPFFTENCDLFDMPNNLFYTRRMTEIAGGIKGSGRAGPVTVGGMDVVLKADDPRFPDDNVAVARAKFDLPGGHLIELGGVGRRQRGDLVPMEEPYYGGDTAAYNNTGEADGRFILPAGFVANGYGGKSQTEGENGDGYFYGGSLTYPGLTDILDLGYYEYAEDFQADISFIQPVELGKRQMYIFGRHEAQINRGGVRAVTPALYADYGREVDGEMVNWSAQPNISTVLNSGYALTVSYIKELDRGYMVYGLPEFRNSSATVSFGRQTTQWGDFGVEYQQGMYYGEYFHNYAAEGSFIPWPIWVLNADVNVYNPRSGDRFYVGNFKSTLNVTESVFWRVILQGDSDARTAAGSTLWGWEFRPGSVAYLAYEQKRDANNHFTLADQILFLKVSYMLTI